MRRERERDISEERERRKIKRETCTSVTVDFFADFFQTYVIMTSVRLFL